MSTAARRLALPRFSSLSVASCLQAQRTLVLTLPCAPQVKQPTLYARAVALVESILDDLIPKKFFIISPTGKV